MLRKLQTSLRVCCLLALACSMAMLFAHLWGLEPRQDTIRAALDAKRLQELARALAEPCATQDTDQIRALCQKAIQFGLVTGCRVSSLGHQELVSVGVFGNQPSATRKYQAELISRQGTVGYLQAELYPNRYAGTWQHPLLGYSLCITVFHSALFWLMWNGVSAGALYEAALAAGSKLINTGKQDPRLGKTLELLRSGKEQVREQNDRLRQLATQDSLTGCLNRRAFFEEYERYWANAKRYGTPLALAMVDIDYFKRVNDTYGHPVGDAVIQSVSRCLIETLRECDLVGRYGGEEFVALLPNTSLDAAAAAAERIRQRVAELSFPGFNITVSVGVSDIGQSAETTLDLLDQADRSLYVAKRSGRNCVVCWDRLDPAQFIDVPTASTRHNMDVAPTADLRNDVVNRIPYQGVTSLLAALSYRDAETAVHCMRVAKLALALGRKFLNNWDQHVLESAALLHDIGKIGVPDAVLLKPDRLTDEERRLMTLHGRMGAEIVEAAFDSPELVEVMRTYSLPYQGKEASDQPRGEQLPICSRIVAIADAFDSMTSDRTYRKGMRPEEALKELRRCAGSQFDPVLVESFAEVLREQAPEIEESSCVGAREVLRGLGQAAEYLVQAFDAGDFAAVKAQSERLASLAARVGEESLQEAAVRVHSACMDDSNYEQVLDELRELVDQCRQLQVAFLNRDARAGANSLV